MKKRDTSHISKAKKKFILEPLESGRCLFSES